MTRFVLRRIIGMIVVMFAVSVLTFLIFNVIPNGDPADRMAGKNSTPVQIAAIEQEWGFDEPIYEQYLTTMEKVFSGELISYANQTNVVDEIKRGIPRTFALAIGAAIIWIVVGVALGLYTAIHAGRFSDTFVTVLALIGVSMPVFWLGALASYYLGFKLAIFPNGGYAEIGREGLWQWFYHLLLPWLVLSTLFIGVYSRVVRSSVLDTINEDYVRTARAKGLSERRFMRHHVQRNSLIPVVTLCGLDYAAVFDLQGVGQYFAESVGTLDVPPVLAVTLFGAFFIVLLNTIVDIVYAALDPRIRLS